MAEAVQGKYDYLDGLVLAFECMHYHGAFYSWRANLTVPFGWNLYIPRYIQSNQAKDCVRGEVAYFKRALEEWLMKAITNQTIDSAISIYNKNRKLLQELSDLRKVDSPIISGEEIMKANLASLVMDKEEVNKELTKMLNETRGYKNKGKSGKRLMLIGPEFQDIEFVKLVESLGGLIVSEDLEFGSRHFEGEVQQMEDRLSAIASRLVDRTPGPSKDYPARKRFDRIMNLVKEFNVQGAIILHRMFCDCYAYDLIPLEDKLKENGVDSLIVKFATTVPKDKIKSKIENFINRI
jgi:benzoyl-CoA reductase subunit C